MVLLSHLSLTFYPYLHAFNGKARFEDHPIQYLIHESPFGFFFSGTSAVFIFFTISGYILSRAALKEKNINKRLFLMSLKRYPRLMIPALASCLLGYIAIKFINIQSPQLTDWINNYGDDQNHSFLGAIYSGTIDVFFLSGKSLYNPVLWTMKIELIGSFVVYFLCFNRASLKQPFLTSCIFLMTIALLLLKIIPSNLALGLISFYGGYLFSIYGQKITSSMALILISVGIYLAGAHNTSTSYTFIHFFLGDHTYKICNFISGFFIVYAVIFNDRLSTIFSGKFSVFMGKVSFSVYLIHIPILSTFGVFVFNRLYEATGMYNIAAVTSSILSILTIYFLSLFFYRSIDLKGMSLSNRLAKYIWVRSNTDTKRL